MHKDVEIEPALQQITNEKIPGNTNNEARPGTRTLTLRNIKLLRIS